MAKSLKPVLSDKQKRFAEEYLVDFNATRAAIRAGYSEKTAYAIGYEMKRHPEVRKYLDKLLEEVSLSARETTKLISDIARANLNDYFTVKEVYHTPQVKKTLKQLIKEIEAQIEDEEEYVRRVKIKGEALDQHKQWIASKRAEIIRYQIELERNPKAWRLVSGEPVLVKVADLDMPRLVKDKEAGRIKSVKHSEFGLNVELYAADGALRDLARIHGLFKDNLDLTTKNQPITSEDLGRLSKEELKTLLALKAKMKK